MHVHCYAEAADAEGEGDIDATLKWSVKETETGELSHYEEQHLKLVAPSSVLRISTQIDECLFCESAEYMSHVHEAAGRF